MYTTHPNFHFSTVRLGRFCNLLSGSTFMRNLGVCSIKFDCLQVMVAPNINSSDCFSRIPVKDINGNTYFLDQTTRILMDHAFPTLCQPALLPTYRTDHREIVVYAPNRRVIIVNPTGEALEPDNDHSSQGIYTEEIRNE